MGILNYILKLADEIDGEMSEKEAIRRIERKIDSLDKVTLPLGLFCSGLPLLTLGAAHVFKNILDLIAFTTNLSTTPPEELSILWWLYLVIGGIMVLTGMRKYKNIRGGYAK